MDTTQANRPSEFPLFRPNHPTPWRDAHRSNYDPGTKLLAENLLTGEKVWGVLAYYLTSRLGARILRGNDEDIDVSVLSLHFLRENQIPEEFIQDFELAEARLEVALRFQPGTAVSFEMEDNSVLINNVGIIVYDDGITSSEVVEYFPEGSRIRSLFHQEFSILLQSDYEDAELAWITEACGERFLTPRFAQVLTASTDADEQSPPRDIGRYGGMVNL